TECGVGVLAVDVALLAAGGLGRVDGRELRPLRPGRPFPTLQRAAQRSQRLDPLPHRVQGAFRDRRSAGARWGILRGGEISLEPADRRVQAAEPGGAAVGPVLESRGLAVLLPGEV